jgi:hypothetical protein
MVAKKNVDNKMNSFPITRSILKIVLRLKQSDIKVWFQISGRTKAWKGSTNYQHAMFDIQHSKKNENYKLNFLNVFETS